MKTNEIRETFLAYFENRGHRILPSSPVIPHGDRTLLFTNAGMNQFKDVFTGAVKPESKRVATAQKCIRAGGKHNDLDNVGYTARHLTFFEMLGNFSFGDYFKKEAIEYAWDLLTSGFKLDPDRLWVTVFRDDDEAHEIWQDHIGVRSGRIVRLGEKDNYWSMGDVGPCGPCSEILLDRGERFGCGPDCGIGRCECDRYFEIWNLVFMQFDQRPGEPKQPLERPSIDTGMGVERLAMVLQGVHSVFETDTLRTIIGRIEEITGVPYGKGEASTPHRVIADHVRSLVFAFADGAEPSNEGRGYVLRRILRRAARYGRKLTGDTGEPLLSRLVGTVLEVMGDAYPEIRDRRSYIEGVIQAEEERFGRTLDQGIQQFEEIVARLRKKRRTVIPGRDAFLLYDTFGFPLDLVEQMGSEIGMTVDIEAYDREMAAQRERSREGAQFRVISHESDEDAIELQEYPATVFVGYETSEVEARILAISGNPEGACRILLTETPFYAESGGQVGDIGYLRGEEFEIAVENTLKERDRWIHHGRVTAGEAGAVRPGQTVRASIDSDRRRAIEKNHTGTHLLHAALRRVLGDHAHQKGSLVEAARLRFDVTHFSGISAQEREDVEELVQEHVAANTAVETFETDYDSAIKQGAMALFGEKYGDRVRVVRIGVFSVELCGGTHVARTGDIGTFALTSEGSVSSGVRRIEAVTAAAAARYHLRNARLLEELSARLRTPVDQLADRVARLQEEVKRLKSSRGRKKEGAPGGPGEADPGEIARETLGSGNQSIQAFHGLVSGGGRSAILEIYDRLKARTPRGVFMLLGAEGEKLAVLVAVSPVLGKAGWDAREIFEHGKEAIGGRGGGRAEMVQGGGTRPQGAPEALESMLRFVRDKAAGQGH